MASAPTRNTGRARPGSQPPGRPQGSAIEDGGRRGIGRQVAGSGGIEVQVDGSGRGGHSQPGGPFDHPGRLRGPEGAGPLGERRHHPLLIQPLVGRPAPLRGRNRVAQQDQGEPVECGLGHTVGSRGDSGPPRHPRHARRSGQLAVGAGRDAGGGLPVGQDEPYAGIGAPPDHADVGTASGNAEHQVGPRRGQPGHGRPGEEVRSGYEARHQRAGHRLNRRARR